MGYGVTWGSTWGSSSGGGAPSAFSTLGPFMAAVARGDGLRLQPDNFDAPEGDFAVCLGTDTPGAVGRFRNGDYFEINQEADFDDALILRMKSRIRGPSSMPANTFWYAKLLIDSTLITSRVILPGRTRDLVDIAANVSHFAAGDHTIRLRLQFIDGAGTDERDLELPAWYVDDLVLVSDSMVGTIVCGSTAYGSLNDLIWGSSAGTATASGSLTVTP